jgi:hypothetical protein
LSWKVGEIVLRNITKIDEFSTHFDHLNLKYAEKIKGFDPSHIFVDHMQSVGFSNAFTQTIIFGEEEGNTQDTLVQPIDDIEIVISTTDQHKKKGKGPNEKGAQSPVVSQKNILPKYNVQTTAQQKNISSGKIQVEEVIKILLKEKWKIPTKFK